MILPNVEVFPNRTFELESRKKSPLFSTEILGPTDRTDSTDD